MIEVIVKDLDGVTVATVSTSSKGKYIIDTNNDIVESKIQEVINRATEIGIPLRSDRRQKISKGIKYERLARWLKPGDEDFLQALADDLVRHQLVAYTIETSQN